jgi:hypothetical protein
VHVGDRDGRPDLDVEALGVPNQVLAYLVPGGVVVRSPGNDASGIALKRAGENSRRLS